MERPNAAVLYNQNHCRGASVAMATQVASPSIEVPYHVLCRIKQALSLFLWEE